MRLFAQRIRKQDDACAWARKGGSQTHTREHTHTHTHTCECGNLAFSLSLSLTRPSPPMGERRASAAEGSMRALRLSPPPPPRTFLQILSLLQQYHAVGAKAQEEAEGGARKQQPASISQRNEHALVVLHSRVGKEGRTAAKIGTYQYSRRRKSKKSADVTCYIRRTLTVARESEEEDLIALSTLQFRLRTRPPSPPPPGESGRPAGESGRQGLDRYQGKTRSLVSSFKLQFLFCSYC